MNGLKSVLLMALNVYPPQVALRGSGDSHRLLAVYTDTDGFTHDITSDVSVSLADPAVAEIRDGLISARQDGDTSLVVTTPDATAALPVSVRDASRMLPANFRLDIIPVLTRAGCNQGTCHGSARGQDGFRLSLFGFDPAGDYHRVTREQATRRINLAIPAESLLLEKATGAVSHTGGKRFDTDSEHYATLLRWLDEGALDAPADSPVVTRITLYPPRLVLRGIGTAHGLLVTADYSDGSTRDVTGLSVFLCNDDSVASLDETGSVVGRKRGEAFLTARFDAHTVGIPILVLPAEDGYQPEPITGDYIDQLIGAKLHKLRLHPSTPCSDQQFLRRVTLDVTGSLPSPQVYHSFLADPDPNKRTAYIDRLLAGDEFTDQWGADWADLLMIRETLLISRKSASRYFEWLQDQIAHTRFDEVVRQLLIANGSTFSDPATNYFAAERDRLKVAENTAQLFLGIRTQCAQCHNHPFDRWTMNDYYGFAGFFCQVAIKPAEDYREWIVSRGGGEVNHPVTGQVVAPKFLGGEVPDLQGRDRRQVVAQWITSPDNPYFSRSLANRLWAHFFGLGIVNPVDDLRVSNPPSNQELLDALGQKLIEYEFDIRRLARDILTSTAYQRDTAHPEDADIARDFGRASYRRIPASALLDCICQVTEAPSKFPGLPLGSRAVDIPDQAPGDYFLSTFGRANRTSVCACETKSEPTLSQALHLLNGETVHGKIAQGNVIGRMLDAGKQPAEIIGELFVRCLSREPTSEETAKLTSLVQSAPHVKEGLEDVFWALLNSREFIFNH